MTNLNALTNKDLEDWGRSIKNPAPQMGPQELDLGGIAADLLRQAREEAERDRGAVLTECFVQLAREHQARLSSLE